MKQAVIFDLDGLLVDSEIEHYRAFAGAMSEFSIEVTEEFYAEYWIKNGGKIPDYLKEFNINITPDVVYTRYRERYLPRLPHIGTMPGARELLDHLWPCIPMSVATGSHRYTSGSILANLKLVDYFATVLTCEDVTKSKPHPDIFLAAADAMGVDPEQCVVIEDAEKGILAAKAAGMKVIGVPNHFTAKHDFSNATLTVNSLFDIDINLIDAL